MKVYPSLRRLIQKEKEFKKKARAQGFSVNVVSGWADEKRVSVPNYHYCHASMDKRYHDTIDTPKVLFSQVQDNVVDWRHIRPYFEWLFNYSPFAPCFITKGAKRALNERVIAFDPNQPANLIGGALIASRLGTERYTASYRIAGRLLIWHRLVELGVHPSLAFTLSHVPSMSKIQGDDLNIKNIREINWKYRSVGHEAISPGEDVYLAEHGRVNGVATHQNFFNNNQVGVDKDSFAKRGERNRSSFLWIGTKSYPELFNVNEFVGDALKEAFHKGIKKSGNPFAAAKIQCIVDTTRLAPFQEAMEVIAGLSPKIVKELECPK
jgi:hypothetical protein